MHTLPATPIVFAVPKRALWLMTTLICGALLLSTAATSDALDLVAFAGIAGPLTSALTQLATLAPGVKALIGFIGFVVALVSGLWRSLPTRTRGRASSRSMAPARSTSVASFSRNGRKRSSVNTHGSSSEDCSTPTAAECSTA